MLIHNPLYWLKTQSNNTIKQIRRDNNFQSKLLTFLTGVQFKADYFIIFTEMEMAGGPFWGFPDKWCLWRAWTFWERNFKDIFPGECSTTQPVWTFSVIQAKEIICSAQNSLTGPLCSFLEMLLLSSKMLLQSELTGENPWFLCSVLVYFLLFLLIVGGR